MGSELIVSDVQLDRAADQPKTGGCPIPLPLPGTLVRIDRAAMADYHALARFHYCAGRPATVCRIVAVRFFAPGEQHCTPVAVGVLSYPTPVCRGRERALHQHGWSYGRRLRFANAGIRTISRVIVHPSFRALGLSTLLVRRLIELCPTRYVEALARMGRAHPLFDRAGMTRFHPDRDDEPVYYLFDRTA